MAPKWRRFQPCNNSVTNCNCIFVMFWMKQIDFLSQWSDFLSQQILNQKQIPDLIRVRFCKKFTIPPSCGHKKEFQLDTQLWQIRICRKSWSQCFWNISKLELQIYHWIRDPCVYTNQTWILLFAANLKEAISKILILNFILRQFHSLQTTALTLTSSQICWEINIRKQIKTEFRILSPTNSIDLTFVTFVFLQRIKLKVWKN